MSFELQKKIYTHHKAITSLLYVYGHLLQEFLFANKPVNEYKSVNFLKKNSTVSKLSLQHLYILLKENIIVNVTCTRN
jgi:hypothetical protein